LIEDVIGKFELTDDQERAFRIIANMQSLGSEQLMMYVGGMEALEITIIRPSWTFYIQNKPRFVVLAPTGTAAALLLGSHITHFRSSH